MVVKRSGPATGPLRPDPWILDGGDRSCGELLLALLEPVRTLPPGSVLRLIATDPAAPLDLPAWCHLTGHRYLGSGRHVDGRPSYDLELTADAVSVRPARPWRLA